MSYSVLADLQQAAGGAQRLVQLTDWDSTGKVDATKMQNAIGEADALIDSYLVKQYLVPLSGVSIGGSMPWAPATLYAVGALVVNAGNVYVCTTTGTSAASGGPVGNGAAIADNGVVWAYVNAALPAVVSKVSARLAVWFMKQARGIVSAPMEALTYEKDIKWLDGVAEGRVALGVAPQPSPSTLRGVDGYSPRPHHKAVSRRKLHGFS